MLSTFSPKGLEQNWLNPLIIGMIRDGMAAIDAGQLPAAWRDFIPVAQREKLKRKHGFGNKLRSFWEAYRNLPQEQASVLKDAIEQQTDLPSVLANDGPCTVITDLPEEMRNAASDLFTYMFDQLATLKDADQCIRDIHYAAIYKELDEKICPFCGLNYFRAPGAPRHALDHFMPISRYPFVGADLKNLPPVCDECNSDFKGAVDVLFDDAGARRRCADPYAGPIYSVQLSASTLFSGNVVNGFRLPNWQIDFIGGPPEQAETWDAIYKIRERYRRDVLDADFLSWVGHFANWFVREMGRGKNAEEVAAELPRYINSVLQEGLADRAFLKVEVFRLIHSSCSCPIQGNDVQQWLWNFVEYAV